HAFADELTATISRHPLSLHDALPILCTSSTDAIAIYFASSVFFLGRPRLATFEKPSFSKSSTEESETTTLAPHGAFSSTNTFPHSRGASPPSGVLVHSTERASPSSPRQLCAFLTGPLSWPTRGGSPAWSTSEGAVYQHRQRIS